jgi:hypothetical protein
MSSYPSLLRHAQRRPIAASMAVLFALSASSTWATPPAVTNCLDDNSGGTLRQAAAGASSGDTIDMSTLPCSTITLENGSIAIPQNILTLHGPGQQQLTITGKNGAAIEPYRIINHTYAGTTGHLYIDNLRIEYGQYSNSGGRANGGCIRSGGSVTLTSVAVYHCTAAATSPTLSKGAHGGGVYAYAGLTIKDHSNLWYNTVSTANPGYSAQGGGAWTYGPFDMSDSVVANNSALGAKAHGGGLALFGNVTISGSAIGANYSGRSSGGIHIISSYPAGITTTISNSTITLNSAHLLVGGVWVDSETVNINNSTIVSNTAPSYKFGSTTPYYYAPGVALSSYFAPLALSLQSTIIANNTSGSTLEDLSFGPTPATVTITGSNNLVRAYQSDVTLPGGQGNLTGVCPLLGPVRDNGGGTYTHALQSGSPAIDAGNNSANDPHTGAPAAYDQRGSPYLRVSGSSADIGAYEYQKTDIVFNAEFETGCE